MVLLYSVRFSRRAVTRPGSAVAALPSALADARPCSDSIHPVTAATSAGEGCGEFLGGIVPAFSLSSTFDQTSSFWRASEGSWSASRLKPAVWIRSLWQVKQFFARTGRTVSW